MLVVTKSRDIGMPLHTILSFEVEKLIKIGHSEPSFDL